VKAVLSVLLFGLLYEIVARSGWFAQALVPTLRWCAHAVDDARRRHDGGHAINTLYRVFAGLAAAAGFGLALGFSWRATPRWSGFSCRS
jgi:ABC-type nitrate/sulfonate/bicarbonate transport system permease component